MGAVSNAKASSLRLGMEDQIADMLLSMNAFYFAHRESLLTVSEFVEGVNSTPLTKVAAIFAFAAIALPKITDARKFFEYAMQRDPLPAARNKGVKNDHIIMSRRILFLYLLVVAYQVFTFPFTLDLSGTQLLLDIAFQSALLILLFRVHAQLKSSLNDRWADDEEKQKAVKDWLNKKLEGLNVKPAELRKLALSLFGLNFVPTLMIWAPQIGDGVARFNEILIQIL